MKIITKTWKSKVGSEDICLMEYVDMRDNLYPINRVRKSIKIPDPYNIYLYLYNAINYRRKKSLLYITQIILYYHIIVKYYSEELRIYYIILW